MQAFADKMIDDHTAAGEKMKAAAAKDGVTPPTKMAEKDKAALEKLQATRRRGFRSGVSVGSSDGARPSGGALQDLFDAGPGECAARFCR